MVNGKKTEVKQELTEQQYRALPLLSSSDLRQFSIDKRKFFKEKVLGEKREEEYNKAILLGSVVHCLLLEPEEFENKFYLTICEKPPTGMLLTFTESLYRHTVANLSEEGELQVEFADLLKVAYDESGYKITLEAVLKKFTGEAEQYYIQLRDAKLNGLEVVCMDDINIANKIVEMVKIDEFAGELFTGGINGITTFNEQKVEEFEEEEVKMKAMLDRILVSEKDKTIQLIDLKVVYDNQNFYREYYLKKQAYIQGYIYHRALRSGKLDLGFDYDNYEILPPVFVAVDSGCFFRPLTYKMTIEDLDKAYNGFIENGRYYTGVKQILDEITWSRDNNVWNITKEAYMNKGIVSLKMN